LELTPKIKGKTIKSVSISTYQFALEEVASGPQKWQPLTRETADHSMPWSVAAVLLDGAFSASIYDPNRLQDSRVLALMNRIVVREDAVLTQSFPESTPCVMEIKTQCGETHRAQIKRALGHPLNPMSTSQVVEKFRQLNTPRLSQDQMDTFFSRVDALGLEDPVTQLVASSILT
jgi:2-methylcitrate dehydratase